MLCVKTHVIVRNYAGLGQIYQSDAELRKMEPARVAFLMKNNNANLTFYLDCLGP